MKAIAVKSHGGPEVLEVVEVPEPEPGPDQVKIRTEAISLNFADIKMREGTYPAGPNPPFTPGLDAAGEVVAVGLGVRNIRPGDRVAAFATGGSYADYFLAPAVMTYSLPEGVDMETGAAFPTIGITAYNLLTLAGSLRAGESVLVHAAGGGVGTLVVQMARMLGAGTVIGTVGDDAKTELVKDLGADAVINYRREDVVDRARDLTGGHGVDLILDSVAGSVFQQNLEILAPFGRLVVYGEASGEPGTTLSNALYPTNRAVIGYSSGGYRKLRPEALRPTADTVLMHLQAGDFRIIIGSRFALNEAAKAHELVGSRRSTGKVLLLP